MAKKRKQHQLIGTIKYCWAGVSKDKRWPNQPFFACEIEQQTLLTKKKTDIFVFSNLVSKDIWNTLATETFKGKKYSFFCEKRTRGWRLKEWEEIKE